MGNSDHNVMILRSHVGFMQTRCYILQLSLHKLKAKNSPDQIAFGWFFKMADN